MQFNEIRQQFTQVEQSINKATQALQTDTTAPPELKESVRQLGTKAKQVLTQASDEDTLRRSIDDLEEYGDRAKRAVESGNVSSQIKTAVLQAHEQISRLKQQLH